MDLALDLYTDFVPTLVMGRIPVKFNVTANAIKAGARDQIEKGVKDNLSSMVPSIVDRMAELPTFMTTEIRFYSILMDEARRCYEFGLFHAAVSLIGITAERFSIELRGNDRIKQWERLIELRDTGSITADAYSKLDEIRRIRNTYLHPNNVGNAKDDSLKAIKLFSNTIQSRFSERFSIQNGKIVSKSIETSNP